MMASGHSTAVPGGMNNTRCRRHRAPGRTLHLIDIENVAGGSRASTAAVAEAVADYRCALAVRAGDHVVIASGRGLLIAAGLAWPGARLLLASGLDGADLALLEAARPLRAVVDSYDRVVIGSGDGIFAALAADLRRAGLVVVVVSRPVALAIDLRDRASLVRRLPSATLVA